jgi:hypothetical protein
MEIELQFNTIAPGGPGSRPIRKRAHALFDRGASSTRPGIQFDFLTGAHPGVRFPRSEVGRKESLMQKGESLTRASRCKLDASKTGGRQQTNCAPKIHSATHGKRGRHDGLDVSLLESVINGDEAALRVLCNPVERFRDYQAVFCRRRHQARRPAPGRGWARALRFRFHSEER